MVVYHSLTLFVELLSCSNGKVTMTNSKWIEEVLADLGKFATANKMPRLSEMINEARIIARTEIIAKSKTVPKVPENSRPQIHLVTDRPR